MCGGEGSGGPGGGVCGGGGGGGREGGTCLQHGVAVCIGDVYLQSSKLGIIVVAKVKHLNPYNHDNRIVRYTEVISMVTRPTNQPSFVYLISTCL